MPKLSNQNEIILVDDDRAELIIATSYLKKSDITNSPITFSSGDDFLKYMKEVKAGKQQMPALVLLDVRMPKMDGFEVLEKMRKEKVFGESPAVIMFSNSDAVSDIQKAFDKGANGYQTKFGNGKEFIAFFNSLRPSQH